MKFKTLDEKMRAYETAADVCVLPEIYMVARIDGRSFTRLTKTVCKFEAPYDIRFRKLMVDTTIALMRSGFDVVYAYTQSDEISLLLNQGETLFGRKLRKLNSVLAGEASASLSAQLGHPAAFDCRVSQLPNRELVRDYFRWRSADALRNALNSYCYWSLRQSGLNAKQATKELVGKSVSEKNELLFSKFGINFNDVPSWQKRGVGLYWKRYSLDCIDQRTGEPKTVDRRKIFEDLELPVKYAYSDFIDQLISENEE
jgi:tRNA(His) 5'-end guanylyltransferase